MSLNRAGSYLISHADAKTSTHGAGAGEYLAKTSKSNQKPEFAFSAVVGKSGEVDFLTTDYATDDAAIQAGIDYVNTLGGGTVAIKNGTYLLASPLQVYSNISIAGNGSASILKNIKAGGGHDNGGAGVELSLFNSCIINADRTLGNTNIHISNIALDAYQDNKTDGFCHCVQLVGVDNSSVENCKMYNSHGDGVELSYAGSSASPVICSNITITNNYISDCVRNGISAIYANGGVFSNNTISDCERGIDCEGDEVQNILMQGNLIKDSTFCGIQASLPTTDTIGVFRNISIISNEIIGVISPSTIYDSEAYGIYVQRIDSDGVFENVIISNNIVSNVQGFSANKAFGIRVQSVENGAIISSNVIENIGGVGLGLGSHNAVSSNNIIDGCTGIGINIDQNYVQSISNTLRNIGGIGIYTYFAIGSYLINNVLENITGAIISTLSPSDPVIQGNVGFNPVGIFTAPSMPDSANTYFNAFGYDCMVIITGGTVSSIDIDGNGTGLTGGCVIVPNGTLIKITYSAAPVWNWWGL
jgi:hypothetical protein